MNIENLQDWMDMPLGSCVWLPGCDILRVPGGWAVANTRLSTMTSCFVPEPPKEVEPNIYQRIRELGFISGQDLNRLREREGLSGYKGPYPEPIPCRSEKIAPLPNPKPNR